MEGTHLPYVSLKAHLEGTRGDADDAHFVSRTNGKEIAALVEGDASRRGF
jgi:hypothetical protein